MEYDDEAQPFSFRVFPFFSFIIVKGTNPSNPLFFLPFAFYFLYCKSIFLFFYGFMMEREAKHGPFLMRFATKVLFGSFPRK